MVDDLTQTMRDMLLESHLSPDLNAWALTNPYRHKATRRSLESRGLIHGIAQGFALTAKGIGVLLELQRARIASLESEIDSMCQSEFR